MAGFDGSYDFSVLPFGGDLTRYGQGPAHRWFDFYAPSEDGGEEEEDAALPPDGNVGQTSINGGPDGGSHNDALGSGQGQQSYNNFGDWARATARGLSMMGPFGFATGVIGQDMAVRDAEAAIASMNQAGGALNPELAGRSDPSQGGGPGGASSGPGEMGGQTEGGFSGSGVEGEGGFMRDGGRVRKGGLPPPRLVRGPGDGRSDSVPAGRFRLSRDEFVFPADSVSAAGRGSTEAGAQKLSALAQALRQQHMSRMGALPPPRA